MTDEDDQPGPDGYALLFPFTATRSHGGPYEDGPFVAGVQLGRIDMALTAALAVDARVVEFMVYTDLVDNLELVGMARGFPVMTAGQVAATAEYPAMPEWSRVVFHRGQ